MSRLNFEKTKKNVVPDSRIDNKENEIKFGKKRLTHVNKNVSESEGFYLKAETLLNQVEQKHFIGKLPIINESSNMGFAKLRRDRGRNDNLNNSFTNLEPNFYPNKNYENSRT